MSHNTTKGDKNLPNAPSDPNHSSHEPSRVFCKPSSWRLADFKLLKNLGTGGFCTLILCRLLERTSKLKSPTSTPPVPETSQKERKEQYFIIKVFKKKHVIRLRQVENLQLKRIILSQMDHPFIAKMHKACQNEENLFMFLEFIGGGELYTHLRKMGKFPNDVARFYAAEILLALEYLHSNRNVVYRNLKLENILLTEEGHVKLINFGLTKEVTEKTWTLCGTPEYLAPEIIQSKSHSKPVDIWALGILIYEMLVGYPPFFDESAFKIYELILGGINKVEFPRYMDCAAKDLILKLLNEDCSKRLGIDEIKNHEWFRGVDFNAVFEKKINPPPITISTISTVHPDTPVGHCGHYYNSPDPDFLSDKRNQKRVLSKEAQALFKSFDWSRK